MRLLKQGICHWSARDTLPTLSDLIDLEMQKVQAAAGEITEAEDDLLTEVEDNDSESDDEGRQASKQADDQLEEEDEEEDEEQDESNEPARVMTRYQSAKYAQLKV